MSFFSGIKDNQKEFLKKVKEQELQAERKKKQQEAILRVAAVTRKFLSNRRNVAPLIGDAQEKVQAIVLKKKEIDSEKYNRMMANAVFKMPIIMAPLSLISFESAKTYQPYLFKVMAAVVSEGDQNPVLKKVLDSGGDKAVELRKLAQFSIVLARNSEVSSDFLAQYIREASSAHFTPDPISNILNSKTIEPMKRLIIDGRLKS